jgi:hypothetical protein
MVTIANIINAGLGVTSGAGANVADPNKVNANLPTPTSTQVRTQAVAPTATTTPASSGSGAKLDSATTAAIGQGLPLGVTREQAIKLATDLSNAKTTEEQEKILSSYTSQGQKNKLETLLALIIPVLLNNGKVDANQVAWWEKAFPAITGMFKK